MNLHDCQETECPTACWYRALPLARVSHTVAILADVSMAGHANVLVLVLPRTLSLVTQTIIILDHFSQIFGLLPNCNK